MLVQINNDDRETFEARALRSKVSALYINTGPQAPSPHPPPNLEKNALNLVFSCWNNNSSAVFLLIPFVDFYKCRNSPYGQCDPDGGGGGSSEYSR